MYSSIPRGLPEQKPEYYGPMIIEAMDTNAVNSGINTKLDTNTVKSSINTKLDTNTVKSGIATKLVENG